MKEIKDAVFHNIGIMENEYVISFQKHGKFSIE
jgi:hypothetical protein